MLIMSAADIFNSEEHGEDSYYIAEDGRVFAISQQDNALPQQDSNLQEIREIPLSGTVVESHGIQHMLEESNNVPIQATHHLPQSSSHSQDHLDNSSTHMEDIETEALLAHNEDLREKDISIPLADDSAEQFLYLPTSSIKKTITVEDFVEIYTIFKCKACNFTCGEKDGLYSHVESEHLNSIRRHVRDQDNLAKEVFNNDDYLSSQGVKDIDVKQEKHSLREQSMLTDQILDSEESGDKKPDPELNAMLIIADVDNVKYNMESRSETVILDDTPTERMGPYPYFKFFLVKEQKEIFICTKCSICMSSEAKMKIHVVGNTCTDCRCKNCGVRFNTQAEYHEHSLKCKVAVFKIKEKQVSQPMLRRAANLQEESYSHTEASGSKNDLFTDCHAEGKSNRSKSPEQQSDDDQQALGDEFQISRLTKNRSDLEVDGEKRVWVCSRRNCYAVFKEESMLDYHASCHRGDSLLCVECDEEKKFTRWIDLSQHLWKDHGKNIDLYQCKLCKTYVTTSVLSLIKHCQSHANQKTYCCDICFKSFNQYVQLKNHSVVHLKENQLTDLPNWAKPKKCDICQRVCSDSKSLKKHVQAVHSQLKPYICQICDYKSARKANLKQHMRQHTGEKPFTCDECDYKTGDLNSLRRHKKRHTGDKPYKCAICPFSTIQSQNYKLHLKQRHQITPDGQPIKAQERKRAVVDTTNAHIVTLETDATFVQPDKSERDLSLTDSLDSLLALSDRTSVNLLSDS